MHFWYFLNQIECLKCLNYFYQIAYALNFHAVVFFGFGFGINNSILFCTQHTVLENKTKKTLNLSWNRSQVTDPLAR